MVRTIIINMYKLVPSRHPAHEEHVWCFADDELVIGSGSELAVRQRCQRAGEEFTRYMHPKFRLLVAARINKASKIVFGVCADYIPRPRTI